MDVAQLTNTFMLALCVYREARNQSPEAARGVAAVVMNRTKHPGWWGQDVFSVVTKPYQFSSFNHADPNVTVFGAPADHIWQECMNIAAEAIGGSLVDPTGGATLYYSDPCNPKPTWALRYKELCVIGAFHFFTDAA